MKDMNLEAQNETCCSDSLVDDLIRTAKRAGKSSASLPTGYPGRYTRGLDEKHVRIQVRWNALIDELERAGYRVTWTHIESFVLECGRNTEYFTILCISWSDNA